MGSGKGKSRRAQATTSGFSIGNDFARKYHDAIRYLDDQFAYFVTHVLNIGEPLQSNAIPTACVALPHKHTRLEDFQFLFSPKFAEKLTDKQVGFVLAHETMHILLNHLRMVKDFDDPQLFNLAADAVINDYLVDIGLELPDLQEEDPTTGEKVGGLITGDSLVGHNCMHSTVTDVYNELKHQQQQQKQDGDGEGGEGNGYGPAGQGFGSIDSHDWMHDPAQGSAERASQEKAADDIAKAVEGKGDMPQDLKDKKKAEDVGQSQGYSLLGGQSEIAFVEEKGLKLKWIKLLKEIEPDILRKRGMFDSEHETWSRPHRKIAAYYPDILLPGIKDDEPVRKQKPSIVLALDTSGSIGANTANKFVNLARSIPTDRVEIHVCTFTTQYMKLDLDNPRFASGGTNFSAVEDFIRKEVMPDNRERYPKAVIVITDGQAEFSGSAPKKENYGSWHWLMEEDNGWGAYNYGPSNKIGKKYQLAEFT